ncbi:MAG TPA: pirin family protein [Ramlibacter sp.]|nr:pirin family protein [Ramlibacter sp.]
MAAALRLSGHEKDLGGGFKVRRLLPAARQRAVGPFIFFDHFGPVVEEPGTNHDVRPHPHIGLATVTYLFEGAMMHRDSLGTGQLVEPGAINLMVAGRGIAHSERRPSHLKDRAFTNHGLQLWVAVPADREEDPPSFSHTPADAIPQLQVDGAQVRVLIGEAFGAQSPVPALSPTLYLDVRLPAGAAFELPPLAKELAVYPVSGEFAIDGQSVEAHQMVVLEPAMAVRVDASADARFVVVGGEPLGYRHMWWNFVSSRAERIVQASSDWEQGRFAKVPGETESIPLPERRFVAPAGADATAPAPASGPPPQFM